MTKRPQIENEAINTVIHDISRNLYKRFNEKGYGIAVSCHEIEGILHEEWNEVLAEVRVKSTEDRHAINEYLVDELFDLIVAAILGILSVRSGKMDW